MVQLMSTQSEDMKLDFNYFHLNYLLLGRNLSSWIRWAKYMAAAPRARASIQMVYTRVVEKSQNIHVLGFLAWQDR